MRREFASLRIGYEGDNDRFQRFNGAIEAAARLGHTVTLRIVNNPRGNLPLDIYADADDGKEQT